MCKAELADEWRKTSDGPRVAVVPSQSLYETSLTCSEMASY